MNAIKISQQKFVDKNFPTTLKSLTEEQTFSQESW